MGLFTGILGKIVTGLVALAVIAAGVSWYQATPEERAAVMQNTGRIAGWVGLVLVLPWATFFATRTAAKFDNNTAGVVLVLGYSLLELGVLLWLFDFSIQGGISWIFVTLGVLLSLVYNLLTCDWLAERFE